MIFSVENDYHTNPFIIE